MTPFKSKPRKSNHYFKIKYPYVCVGTLVSMRITDIMTKNSCFFFCHKAAFGKEAKTIIVVDTSLHSLMRKFLNICIADFDRHK